MKKLFSSLALIALVSASTSAFADSSYTGKILKIHSGPNVGPSVFLVMDGEKNSNVETPCSIHASYDYVFDASTEAGKITLSMALAAYAAGKTVYVGGPETCELVGTVEELKWLRLQ